MKLPERLARVLALEPDSAAIEYEGRSRPWKYLSTFAQAIDARLTSAGIGAGEGVGVLASNRPTVIAAIAALLLTRRCVVFVNPSEPEVRIAEEIRRLRLKAFMADAGDWSSASMIDALAATGTLGLMLDDTAQTVTLHPALATPGPGPWRPADERIALDQTTSGTTGPPKRATTTYERLATMLGGGHPDRKNEDPASLRVQRSPALAIKAIAHAGGTTYILLALYEARPIVLYDRFEVGPWVDAVRRYRPRVTSLVPAMVQMVWDAGVPQEALESLIAIRTGTAPLDRHLQDRFEERYGIPLLIDYGGTEIGPITAWSLNDYRKYAKAKRGSVGRVKRGVGMRVVDEASGAELPPRGTGVLEVHNAEISPEWIRTTDLASIDEEGFLYIHGRSDGAIIRGGFKVLPEIVAQALRQHPLVRDAVVLGIADTRLGQVPVAVVEPRDGRQRPEGRVLVEHLRGLLPPYQVPVEVRVVDSLPRTASLKVSLSEVKAMLDHPVPKDT